MFDSSWVALLPGVAFLTTCSAVVVLGVLCMVKYLRKRG